MNIYEKLAKMSKQQINAVWRALKDYDPAEDSRWYDSTENISMNDWMQAVYSEMDRRGMPHFDKTTDGGAFDANNY